MDLPVSGGIHALRAFLDRTVAFFFFGARSHRARRTRRQLL